MTRAGTVVPVEVLVASPGPDEHARSLVDRRVVVMAIAGGTIPGLVPALHRAGCLVEQVHELVQARRALTALGPRALVVLDAVMWPTAMNTALPALSQQDAVVVCLPRTNGNLRSSLLARGADHVLSGASEDEVVSALAAVARRFAATAQEPRADLLTVGDLSVHLSARVATSAGRTLRLTSLEFDLLAYFLARPGLSLSRECLLRDVWGYDIGGLDTVTVHVRRLRTKVEQDPSRPLLLQTVWGVGYRLAADVDLNLPLPPRLAAEAV